MTTTAKQIEPEILTLSEEEARQEFDELARTLMGMSGEEFLRRWDSGEYREIGDLPGHRHIVLLAGFLPLVRPDA
jgi:hypothetical protein